MIKMCTRHFVLHTTQQPLAPLSTYNRESIIIGVWTNTSCHDLGVSTLGTRSILRIWRTGSQTSNTKSWLQNPATSMDVHNRPITPHADILHWHNDFVIAPTDVPDQHAYDWLRLTFPEVYEAPSGWRYFSTMTTHTVTLISAIAYPTQTQKVNAQFFTVIWQSLYHYWKTTCSHQINENAVQIETDHRDRIRTHMQNRQEASRLRPAGILARFALQLRRLRLRHDRFHQTRRRALPPAPHLH